MLASWVVGTRYTQANCDVSSVEGPFCGGRNTFLFGFSSLLSRESSLIFAIWGRTHFPVSLSVSVTGFTVWINRLIGVSKSSLPSISVSSGPDQLLPDSLCIKRKGFHHTHCFRLSPLKAERAFYFFLADENGGSGFCRVTNVNHIYR